MSNPPEYRGGGLIRSFWGQDLGDIVKSKKVDQGFFYTKKNLRFHDFFFSNKIQSVQYLFRGPKKVPQGIGKVC